MKKILSLLFVFVMVFSLVACSFQKEEEVVERQNIVATNYVIYSITKQIVKNTADITLVEKKENLSAKELRTLREADLIIYQGEEIEPWVNNLLVEELKDTNIKTINAIKGVSFEEINYNDNLFSDTTGFIENEISSEIETSSEEISNKTEINSSENKNDNLQSSLFEESSSSVSNFETISSEINSSEVSEESSTAEEISEEQSDELSDSEIKKLEDYFEDIKIYDTVKHMSPIRDYLYEQQEKTDKDQIEYSFDNKIYVFAYSRNNKTFFLIEIKAINAYTEKEVDPYYWLSFNNVKIMAENIKEGLGLISEEYSSIRIQNYNSFIEDINALSERYSNALSGKKTLTLGCKYIPATIINTYELTFSSPYIGNKLTLRGKANYCDYLKRNKFSSSIFSITGDITANEFAEELGLTVEVFNTLEHVENIEKTYVTYMTENLDILLNCLN